MKGGGRGRRAQNALGLNSQQMVLCSTVDLLDISVFIFQICHEALAAEIWNKLMQRESILKYYSID